MRSAQVIKKCMPMLGFGVPMDTAKVYWAFLATLVQERLQPLNTLASVAAVGDRWRSNLGPSGISTEVLHMGYSSCLGGHVCLVMFIGLVETEHEFGPLRYSPFGIRVPMAGMNGDVTPQHRNVAEARL